MIQLFFSLLRFSVYWAVFILLLAPHFISLKQSGPTENKYSAIPELSNHRFQFQFDWLCIHVTYCEREGFILWCSVGSVSLRFDLKKRNVYSFCGWMRVIYIFWYIYIQIRWYGRKGIKKVTKKIFKCQKTIQKCAQIERKRNGPCQRNLNWKVIIIKNKGYIETNSMFNSYSKGVE